MAKRYHTQGKLQFKNLKKIRRRIIEAFDDGNTVIVFLKERSKKQTSEEKDWYDKAFGPK